MIAYARRNLGGALALALLTASCVLLAVGAPRLALSVSTTALRQLLAQQPAVTRSVQVSGAWSAMAANITAANGSSSGMDLTSADITGVAAQLLADYTAGPVRLAPLSQAWASLTSTDLNVKALLPGLHGERAQLELVGRTPLDGYATLVAGRYPQAPPQVRPQAQPAGPPASLQVAVTQQTAAQFGLRPGSVVSVTVPGLGVSAHPLSLQVTGILRPQDPGEPFWTVDPTAARPVQIVPSQAAPPYWIGGVLIPPSEAAQLQRAAGPQLTASWFLPVTAGDLRGDQAQQLYDTLNRAVSQAPVLPSGLAPAQSALTASTGLLQPLRGFLATQRAVATLQWLLFASLAVTALAVLLLAGRMVAVRRAPELTMLRARGASLPQVAGIVARDALAACLPGAVVAWAAGLAVSGLLGDSGGSSPWAGLGGFRGSSPWAGIAPAGLGGWLPGLAVLLVAVAGPAIAGTWPLRPPRRGRARQAGHSRRSRRVRLAARLVAEATLCALAVAALVVLREQGASAADLLTSAVPALVAIPVVVAQQWLYPLVLRGALRLAARGRNATAFLALSAATRTALTPTLPMFALVLALTVAAFGGMTRAAITRGDNNASWAAVGGDVSIGAGVSQSAGAYAITGAIPPAVVADFAAVPGVRHAAGVVQAYWTTPAGQQVDGIAVDPAGYAALIADSPGTWPPFPAGLLSGRDPGGAVPVLATPDVAAQLKDGTVTLTTSFTRPVSVHVAGIIGSTPALPGTGSFMVLPVGALRPNADPIWPNLLLLTGTGSGTGSAASNAANNAANNGIDRQRLDAVLAAKLPGATAAFRSATLSALTSAPLQDGTFRLFAIGIAASAVLGLMVLLLALALGTAGRELTLARLATMGLSRRQRASLIAMEAGPAVIAAGLAGVAAALLLPGELGPALDLSAFTGSTVPVPFTADALSIAAPVAGLAVIATIALTVELRAGRRLGVAPRMRGD